MQTPTRYVDVAVIGAGTAGQVAFKKVLKNHENTVIINNGFWTTTCATVGCMPSKLLIAAAHRASYAMHSEEFGVSGDIQIDGKAVMARVQRERDRFTSFITQQVERWDDNKTIDGIAKIVGKDENGHALIAVNEELISAKKLIIATGSTPFVPDEWKNLGERVLTSDTVFELTDLPKTLAVIGTGAIGLELAQAMAKLGVTVKLFNRQAKVGGISDEALNAIAIDVLANNPNTPTLELLLNVKIDGLILSEDGEQISVDYQDLQGSKQRFSADRVLLAIGRKTHLASLGVQSIDVEIDERGNPKNVNPKTGQVGDSNVYIIGDANAILPLMHVASDEGYNAGSVVCGDGNSDLVFQRVPMAITFTEPNICQVGENLPTLNAMQDKGELQFVTGRVNFSNQGRSRVMGVNMGQMHIYAHKDNGKILGASMIAPDGEYLTHLLALAIDNGLTAKKMLEMPFYHPTIVEALRTCLRDVERQLHIEFIPNEKLTP